MKLSTKLTKYHLKQHVTNFTTINNSTIDFIFTNMTIDKINNFYAHWSDHYMIQIKTKYKEHIN